MHHRLTYMYINFQQNLASRAVKTNFEKNRLFETCVIVTRTCISIINKIGFGRSVKSAHNNLFAKKWQVA